MAAKRVNIRVHESIDEWFTRRSEETGVSKSSLMALALEDHIIQRQALTDLSSINKLIELQEKHSSEKIDS